MRLLLLPRASMRFVLVALLSWPTLLSLAPVSAAHPSMDARIAALSRQIAAEPRNASLLLDRATAHRDHEDWPAARADIDAARALDAETPGLDLASGAVALGEGHPDAALTFADHALARNPRDADAWLLRARALESLSRSGDAAAALGSAIASIEPPARPQPDLYLKRARLLASGPSPRSEEALRTLDAGLARLGPLVSLSLPAVDLEISLGQFDAARTRLEALPLASAEKDRLRARIPVAAEATR